MNSAQEDSDGRKLPEANLAVTESREEEAAAKWSSDADKTPVHVQGHDDVKSSEARGAQNRLPGGVTRPSHEVVKSFEEKTARIDDSIKY